MNGKAEGLDILPAVELTPVEEDKDGEDPQAGPLRRFHGLYGRSSGGNHIVDDDHLIAGLHIAFDLAHGAVALRFLSDHHRLDGFITHGGSVRRGGSNRVSAHGEPPDGLRPQAEFPDHVKDEVADEILPQGGIGGLFEVEIETAHIARGELVDRGVAPLEGVLLYVFDELGPVIHHLKYSKKSGGMAKDAR